MRSLFHLIMTRFIKNDELIKYFGFKRENLITKEDYLHLLN